MNNAVFWIFFFLVGLPMTLTAILQLFAGGVMAGLMLHTKESIENQNQPIEYSIPGLKEVINDHKSYATRKNFISLAKFDSLDAPRSIWINTSMQVRDLMKSGDKLPSSDFEEVFMETRVGIYAQEECKQLLRALAKECIVKNSIARKKSEKDYQVVIELGFVQKDEFGKIPEKDTAVFREIETEREKKVSVRSFDARKQKNFRASSYSHLVKQCATFREKFGNCAISNAKFSMSRYSWGSTSGTATARAKFEMSFID